MKGPHKKRNLREESCQGRPKELKFASAVHPREHERNILCFEYYKARMRPVQVMNQQWMVVKWELYITSEPLGKR